MVMHQRGNSGSKVWSTWHEERQAARETAMSAEEFGPIETEAYDLDTAGITGESNPETYTTDPYGETESVDYREVDPRF